MTKPVYWAEIKGIYKQIGKEVYTIDTLHKEWLWGYLEELERQPDRFARLSVPILTNLKVDRPEIYCHINRFLPFIKEYLEQLWI